MAEIGYFGATIDFLTLVRKVVAKKSPPDFWKAFLAISRTFDMVIIGICHKNMAIVRIFHMVTTRICHKI